MVDKYDIASGIIGNVGVPPSTVDMVEVSNMLYQHLKSFPDAKVWISRRFYETGYIKICYYTNNKRPAMNEPKHWIVKFNGSELWDLEPDMALQLGITLS